MNGAVMTAYWFKPKRYGYGATPIAWQGWLLALVVTIIWVGSLMLLPLLGRESNWLAFAIVVAVDVLAFATLWIVGRRKTDGEWRWRWGDR